MLYRINSLQAQLDGSLKRSKPLIIAGRLEAPGKVSCILRGPHAKADLGLVQEQHMVQTVAEQVALHSPGAG